MAKVYKDKMIDVLTKLGITIPDYITMDQKQIEKLVSQIKTALDTYDPLPTGNATVADVAEGKTFSNATGLGLVGTYTLAGATVGDAVAADIASGKIAWVNGVQITGTHV